MDQGGLADRLGLQPGDRLVSINGHVLRDVIDYRFYGADEQLEIEIDREGERLCYEVQRRRGEEFGLRFTEDVFDGLRVCNNCCAFCFVDQMPPGMRRSLYVKDDDYRYSFLHGNFVTLSNWSEQDWERIAEQHLSPLYISVHATEPAVRRRIFNNPRLPDIRSQLHRLAEIGIEMHTQIVVLPGLNDGQRLKSTVEDLAGIHPAVCSIGVVPVGLTKYHPAGLRLLTPGEERAIVREVMSWQAEYRRRYGIGLVYASDELYLRGRFPIPSADRYDGFPQLENGIGLARQLLDEWDRIKNKGSAAANSGKGTVVCGTLIAPVLEQITEDLNDAFGLELSTIPVENRFFGSTVSVSGLLTGGDVLEALAGVDVGGVLFLPRSMFEASGEVTLDGLCSGELESHLGVAVVATGSLHDVLGRCGVQLPGAEKETPSPGATDDQVAPSSLSVVRR